MNNFSFYLEPCNVSEDCCGYEDVVGGSGCVCTGGVCTNATGAISMNTCVDRPSESPSAMPSVSQMPSMAPSNEPSLSPSTSPSSVPSRTPSVAPSDVPSVSPSSAPSSIPSEMPSDEPSVAPSDVPSQTPTMSSMPSAVPSSVPSAMPSAGPTSLDFYCSTQPSGDFVARSTAPGCEGEDGTGGTKSGVPCGPDGGCCADSGPDGAMPAPQCCPVTNQMCPNTAMGMIECCTYDLVPPNEAGCCAGGCCPFDPNLSSF